MFSAVHKVLLSSLLVSFMHFPSLYDYRGSAKNDCSFWHRAAIFCCQLTLSLDSLVPDQRPPNSWKRILNLMLQSGVPVIPTMLKRSILCYILTEGVRVKTAIVLNYLLWEAYLYTPISGKISSSWSQTASCAYRHNKTYYYLSFVLPNVS